MIHLPYSFSLSLMRVCNGAQEESAWSYWALNQCFNSRLSLDVGPPDVQFHFPSNDLSNFSSLSSI